ncbi:hypothetical protein QYF61_015738 [Mycteria americana]|uniref:Uncharacterized protein n=1 Tax=Mycteria americana TaxID=33587 RepID=A0AAN7MQK4_MYCAM|nr:hypothetical protein QYF61_015738 [Mycteria americana]
MVHLSLQNVRRGSGELQTGVWAERIHLRTLRNLADVPMRPLYLIFQRSQRSEEVPDDWRKASVESTFKGGKRDKWVNYRCDSLTLVSKKLMEQKRRLGIARFDKGKLCLTNLIPFNDKRLPMIHFKDEGKTEGLKYILTLLKLYIKLSHHSLINKLKKYRLARLLDELTIVQTTGLTE